MEMTVAQKPNEILAVGDVADRLGVEPRRVTELFYTRQIHPDRAPVVAGRRLIPAELVPVIGMLLRRKGLRIKGGNDGRP